MEINTTIGEFTNEIKHLNKPSNTPITVIIRDHLPEKDIATTNASKYPFLHSGFWEGEGTPTDLAATHDQYLYDEQ